jgi:hypothetical protein
MDKKKVPKPKVKKPKGKKPKGKKPKGKKPKVKKPKVKKPKQKGGSDNIENTTVGLFKSFFAFGKDIFAEIDLLTQTPGQLGIIAN